MNSRTEGEAEKSSEDSTILRSTPLAEPIQTILHSKEELKASATASPGKICPPVPPPVKTTHFINVSVSQ